MNISHLMNKTAVHYTKSRVSDSQGGWTEAFVAGSTYSVRLSQPKAGLQQKNDMGKDRAHVSHEVYFSPPPDAGTFKENERFIIDSRTFEIKIPNITPSIAVYQKVAVLEIQP